MVPARAGHRHRGGTGFVGRGAAFLAFLADRDAAVGVEHALANRLSLGHGLNRHLDHGTPGSDARLKQAEPSWPDVKVVRVDASSWPDGDVVIPAEAKGLPVVEIYGILEGQMEIWWKPYYDRGTSAWNHPVSQVARAMRIVRGSSEGLS